MPFPPKRYDCGFLFGFVGFFGHFGLNLSFFSEVVHMSVMQLVSLSFFPLLMSSLLREKKKTPSSSN